MQAPDLTLDAAIRDASSQRAEARHRAIRNVAAALLGELGEPGPLWDATSRHARGEEARDALRTAVGDDDAALAGVAAIGLGMLGDAWVVEKVWPWTQRTEDDEAARFWRECAVIAISLVGAAASEADRRLWSDLLQRLRSLLTAPRPDVRFQAAMAAMEVGGQEVEADLVARLEDEEHPEVRQNLVEALSRLDPPGPAACKALAQIVADDEEGATAIGFEAALTLAAARRTEAGPRLVEALRHRLWRDRALEALAVLGRAAPPEAVPAVHSLARGLLTPGITRVRAAYALARLVGGTTPERNPGLALLQRLAWHPRPGVREAVADAQAALRELAER